MYFVTICTHNNTYFFGDVVNNEMKLKEFGNIVQQQWLSIPKRFSVMQLDEFIVMPNHFHGIFSIVGAPLAGARYNSQATPGVAHTTVGQIVGAFKSLCVNRCLKYIKQNNQNIILGKLWQRNYYEHIIRNEHSLNKIREYIINNPIKWQFDCYYLGRTNET